MARPRKTYNTRTILPDDRDTLAALIGTADPTVVKCCKCGGENICDHGPIRGGPRFYGNLYVCADCGQREIVKA